MKFKDSLPMSRFSHLTDEQVLQGIKNARKHSELQSTLEMVDMRTSMYDRSYMDDTHFISNFEKTQKAHSLVKEITEEARQRGLI